MMVSDGQYRKRQMAGWRVGSHTKKKKFICSSCGVRVKLQPRYFRKACAECGKHTLTQIPHGGMTNLQIRTGVDDAIHRRVDGSFESKEPQ